MSVVTGNEMRRLTGDLQKLVRKAQRLKDPMQKLQSTAESDENSVLKKFDGEFTLTSSYGTCLPDEIFEWAFALCKQNMRSFYVDSEWGWDDKDKRHELQATTSRYLVVRGVSDGKPVAYCHYRFDGDNGLPVLYCYELQVEPDYQRKGLGCWLLSVLMSIARTTGMAQVMATVFKHNPASLQFFRNRQFDTDETNDPQTDYLILSRTV